MLSILILLLVIFALLIVLATQARRKSLRGIGRGLLVSYFTFVWVLIAGELFFRYAYAESENTLSLATVNWLDRHWQENALGYRDREWTPSDWEGKTTVVVTGDSFTAGWGIENPADRYADVLANLLGDGYALMNLGIYGTSTPEQLEFLQAFPLRNPDIVIAQYFLNDINYTMLARGILPEVEPPPTWAQESYLGNFLYTRLIGALIDPAYNRSWWEDNYAAYDNFAVWEAHRAEIEAYIDYVEGIEARLIVVIFPNMLDPVRSVAYVDRVAHVFENRGHDEILRLFDAAAAWSLEDRIVSPRDTHPSVAFHYYVGEILYEQFFVESEP
jgi:lysophospholipase L1-like esterase